MRVAFRTSMVVAGAIVALIGSTGPVAGFGGDTLVNVGSPTTPFSQNKQNEPAVAIDANHPNVLAAGANDEIDMEACNAGSPTTCPFTPGVGSSGIYFSFDSGQSWTQPTYTGLTARDCLGPAACTPHLGPIGTLPWYYEAGLASGGDPALAFGPRPGGDGSFSWANGSRLYYANLVANVSAARSDAAFKGVEAVAVSRTDDVAAAAAGDKSAWRRPVIVSRQSATLFSDKEQIWADNAASSPYFGNVYVCSGAFRSNSHGLASPVPEMVSISHDGGSTWRSRQVTSAVANSAQGYRSACSIRTDSHGVVYLFLVHFQVGSPGIGAHELIRSFDGGQTWTQPQVLFSINDSCYTFDPVVGRCVMDGIAGARNDLSAGPSVDIANGAPTGTDATDEIVDSWTDGRPSMNHESVMLSYSANRGRTWSTPTAIQDTGDRGLYAAPALSPDGTDLYVVYNAFTTPYRTNTTSPRWLVGVVKHANIGSAGAPTAWSTLHRGTPGDARGTSQNDLVGEFLGDYVFAAATRTYGTAVWNDARNAADCPAIDAWRMSLEGSGGVATPAVQSDCPATFGNSDIYGGSYLDPTP